MVLRVSAIVESTIKSIDITAITWKTDGSTNQTKYIDRSILYFIVIKQKILVPFENFPSFRLYIIILIFLFV